MDTRWIPQIMDAMIAHGILPTIGELKKLQDAGAIQYHEIAEGKVDVYIILN